MGIALDLRGCITAPQFAGEETESEGRRSCCEFQQELGPEPRVVSQAPSRPGVLCVDPSCLSVTPGKGGYSLEAALQGIRAVPPAPAPLGVGGPRSAGSQGSDIVSAEVSGTLG